MGSHSVTCHPTEARIPPLPPAEAGTRLSDPGGMQGWVDLCYVKATSLELNPRPVNRESNALPLSHQATQTKANKQTKKTNKNIKHIHLLVMARYGRGGNDGHDMILHKIRDTIWYSPKMLHYILLYTQVGLRSYKQSEITAAFSLLPSHVIAWTPSNVSMNLMALLTQPRSYSDI